MNMVTAVMVRPRVKITKLLIKNKTPEQRLVINAGLSFWNTEGNRAMLSAIAVAVKVRSCHCISVLYWIKD